MMRVFRFKNNIINMKCFPANGEYCIIGYYDALDMNTDANLAREEIISLLSDPNVSQLSKAEELCDYYTIIGFRDEKDDDFWKWDSLIFVSCIRWKEAVDNQSEVLRNIENENTVVYTTLDSSDVIICYRSNSYLDGQDNLHRIQNDVCSSNVLIAFSVIAVRQELLDCLHDGIDVEGIYDEKISAIEKCIVKNRIESHKFVNTLRKTCGTTVKCSEIIGSDDMLLWIEDISLKRWLSLFAINGILTHSYYQKAFYNIQSTIMPNSLISEEDEYQPVLFEPKPVYTDNELIRLHDKFRHDKNLCHYFEKVMKLKWAYAKINDNDLTAYLDNMLSRVYPLFEKYFIDRVVEYQQNTEEKDKILQDIDDSIEKFWECEDAILHTTNAADRIVIQTATIDTGLRYIGPKLCHYYSEMLRELGEVFYPNGMYGFIVSPTVKAKSTAAVLFSTNQSHGKVSCICASENNIADVRMMNILLLHEFFHICSIETRLRKQRSINFLRILLYDIFQEMFYDYIFENKTVEERITEYFKDDILKIIVKHFEGEGEDSRKYYGSFIMEDFSQIITEQIAGWVNLSNDQIIYLLNPDSANLFSNYARVYNHGVELNRRIRNTVINILAQSRIVKICKHYMGVFQEAYCDLMGILTLRVKPGDYIDSFKYISFGEHILGDRDPLVIRAYLVMRAITTPLSDLTIIEKLAFNGLDNQERMKIGNYFFEEWSVWKASLFTYPSGTFQKALFDLDSVSQDHKIRNLNLDIYEGDKNNLFGNIAIFDEYNDYFVMCRDKYLKFMLDNTDKFEHWNRKYMIQESFDTFCLLRSISLREWEKIDG